MINVYAVFKSGIYRHECGGIFHSQEEAISAATHFANSDIDDYHDYKVVPFVLNERSAVYGGESYWSPKLKEDDPVFSIRKPKTPPTTSS